MAEDEPEPDMTSTHLPTAHTDMHAHTGTACFPVWDTLQLQTGTGRRHDPLIAGHQHWPDVSLPNELTAPLS